MAFNLKEKAKSQLSDYVNPNDFIDEFPLHTNFEYTNDDSLLFNFWGTVCIPARMQKNGKRNIGLAELVMYGLKGMAAYADHASILKYTDKEVMAFFHETLSFLTIEHTDEELLSKALEVGKVNLRVMELLDSANTTTFGHPEPTKVRVSPIKGKAILVSGHDLKDLEELLRQTEGLGINIYTHGEMLPAHGYPQLNKYKHLAGNFGGAWQDQMIEFDQFPGPILMTTNCIQLPRPGYQDRIYTCGLVQWPGIPHLANNDFSTIINQALELPGFTEDTEEKFILTGFGRNAVMNVADKVIDAVKAGDIKHFFLIGGCDGGKSGRNYYTDLALSTPKDTVILTLACGKYRFNKHEFGDINGIPRLLDIGQCNDAYSAIQIAAALANAFETDVNGLPLSFVISWYEQKAVAILLTLLHLGIKNIKLGPTLPAFLEPEIIEFLVNNFGISLINNVETDLAEMLA
jgi:hydroxylamine reductase